MCGTLFKTSILGGGGYFDIRIIATLAINDGFYRTEVLDKMKKIHKKPGDRLSNMKRYKGDMDMFIYYHMKNYIFPEVFSLY